MEEKKLRVSQHSERSGSARHNDRSFLKDKDPAWISEHADHIDLTTNNAYWAWDRVQTDQPIDFEKSERDYYRQTYSEAQDAINARNRKSGHADRCRTTDQIYEDAKTKPEEMLLQIGDKTSDVDPVSFMRCVVNYVDRLKEWSDQHGGCMQLLTIAVHLDETSPHAHIRRVWNYVDKEGHTRPGQDKALQAAGVELPDPTKPKGRYNNRKMSFDSMARSIWQEVCIEHGYDIETEPRPGVRHKDKAEYIQDQIRSDIDKLQQTQAELQTQIDRDRQKATEAAQKAQEEDRIYRQAAARTQQLREEVSELGKRKVLLSVPDSAEIGEIRAAARPTLGGKVALPRENYERLCNLAEGNYTNQKAVSKMWEAKKTAERQLLTAYEDAKAKAAQTSLERTLEAAKKEKRLSQYESLEDAFPDRFKLMRADLQRGRDQSRGWER